jgi:TorA maturation chaperone TorD
MEHGNPTSAETRGQIYWFLSSFCLEPPTAQQLNNFVSSSLVTVDQDDPITSMVVRLIDCAQLASNKPDLINELAKDYVRLFHGLQEGYGPPPPYESVYRRSPDPLEIINRVATCYRDAGFSCIPGVDDQPDHLGAELRFMALLCQVEADTTKNQDPAAIATARDLQLSFLDGHLLKWAPQCCGTLLDASKEDYFKHALALIPVALKSDRTLLP